MNIQEAIDKTIIMLDEDASRSKVCSFINTLASSKLITEQRGDQLADILVSDRSNNRPVLNMIYSELGRNSANT